MKATVKHIVKKVTLESIYDVVDERTKEIKEEIKSLQKKTDEMRTEYMNEFKQMRTEFTKELKEMRTEYKDDFKSINGRIDQIHTRLDQMMHMLSDLKSSLK